MYYTKKDAVVNVHYYEEGTTNKVSEDTSIEGKVFDEYETEEADDIPDKYELVAEPENKTGEMTEEPIEVIYYYRKKATKVIVHHYEEGTVNALADDEIKEGTVDKPYTTSPSEDVDGKYELCEDLYPTNAEGNMTLDTIEVIYYYRLKPSSVVIKYVDEITGEEIADRESIDGKVDDPYSVPDEYKKEIEGYEKQDHHSGNESGYLEIEQQEIIYYYKKKTKATVQYIDITDPENEVIMEQSTESGLVGDKFETNSKNYEGYILVEEPAEKTVNMTAEEIVLKYYYKKIKAQIAEKHIDIIAGDILANEEHEGHYGDEYNVPSREFEGYDLVEDRLPDNATGIMTIDPIEVIYYYKYRTKVTARYIDRITGDDLTPEEVQEGHEKDEYTTERKNFDGYVLIEVPENADGEMTKDEIIVTYYYKHISGGVIVNHIDINTGKQLTEEVKIEGYEGEPYETSEKEFPGYILVEDRYPENATGTLKVEEQEVIYYYESPAKVIVNYYDEETKEKLAEEVTINGYATEEYETEEKKFDYYVLTEVPENKSGVMTLKITELDDGTYKVDNTEYVNYYYRKMTFNLKIDKIIDRILIDGKETVINSELGKAEVQRANLAKSKVQVIYTIKVTNDGELAGSASIMENIPDGMKMLTENNKEWKISNSVATVETEEIKPGESKEYKVTLDWQNGEQTLGTMLNTADIVATRNSAGFEELNLNDNKSGATVIVAIGTGDSTYIAIAGAVMLVLIAAGVVIYKKK